MASVASTYARAFADVVLEERLDVKRAVEGLRAIADLFEQSTELRRVWENPAVPAEQKRGLLDAIVRREGIEKPVRNLVAVLIDHRRVQFLPRVAEQLSKELDARLGFAEAQVSSARQLGDAEKRVLEAQIEKTTGKKVRARYELDASLLGGAVVRVGSTIYDGSVKGRLEKIKEVLSS
ncbi:MAG TPA: ATP synthase F1 subunit delta [Verrucomicrobiae bacterium]|nr:ATP synthase F1 subunit delta [Verrucomicrobiae bacterium]